MRQIDYQALAELKSLNLAAIRVEGRPYTPQPAQLPIHQAQQRVILISGGEGSGKSVVTAAEIAARYGLWRLVYLVAPKYESAHKEFDYCTEMLSAFGAVASLARPKSGKCVLTTREGARIETLSSEDGAKAITGTGESPDVIAMVEAGKQSYDIYLACRARVARVRGTLILSGTIEASERWYPELVKRWQAENPEHAKSFIIPTWENRHSYPGGRQDPEILALEAAYPPDKFMERFGAVPCPPATLVFREFRFTDDPQEQVIGHVKAAPYWADKDSEWKRYPVELAVDPGYAGAYVVLALQWQGDTVWVIDEVYRQHTVAEDIINECKLRPWWKQVKGGVIDIAGRQHQGLPSHVEVWQRQANVLLRSNTVRISDGILRHRTFLRNPLTNKPRLFHDPRCKGTLREYGLYKYREVIDGRPVSEDPIDADNHACVVGDTLIDTPSGRHKIADLVGTNPYVYCCIDGKVAVRKASNICKTRADAPIVKLIMDRGQLILTPDHLVMLANGKYIEAGKLRPGQSLMVLNRYVTMDGYTRVCMTGQTRTTQAEHRLVYEQVYGPIPDDMHVHHKDTQPWNNDPANLELLSLEDHASRHHRGKILSLAERKRVATLGQLLWQSRRERMLQVARQNIEFAHQANVGRAPTPETIEKIRAAQAQIWTPERRAEQALRSMGRKHSKESIEKMRAAKLAYWSTRRGQGRRLYGENHRVIAVVPCGEADVYDMTVEDAHNFVANDVVLHNCKALAYWLYDRYGAADVTAQRIARREESPLMGIIND